MVPAKVLVFDEAEMVVRMIEAFEETSRPFGMTAAEALSTMDHEERLHWLRVARAVQEYINEVFSNAQTVQ